MHPLSSFKYCPKCGSDKFVENSFKSKMCENCSFVYFGNPAVGVTAIIENQNGDILCCIIADGLGKDNLGFPGGFIDIGETAEEAVIREIKEETNLSVIETNYLFSVINEYPYKGFTYHPVDLVFKCKIKTFKGMKAMDDVKELLFIPRKDLKKEIFWGISNKETVRRLLLINKSHQ